MTFKQSRELSMSRRDLIKSGSLSGLGMTLALGCDGEEPGNTANPYVTSMQLTSEEQDQLDGRKGRTIQKVMETLCRYGDFYGADVFVPTEGPSHLVMGWSQQAVFGPIYPIVEELVREGYKIDAGFTIDPRPMDFAHENLSSIQETTARLMFAGQDSWESDLRRLGLRDDKAFSCACYVKEMGNTPKPGQILAWAESSAVSFANSALGARTNRNSSTIEIFCGIIGKAPRFGFLTDAGRRAVARIDVRTSKMPMAEQLGEIMGDLMLDGVPLITGLDSWIGKTINDDVQDYLKDMGAAAASRGAVGLYHVENLTPDAVDKGSAILKDDVPVFVIDDSLVAKTVGGFGVPWRDPSARPEMVVLGCPHLSRNQVNQWTDRIEKGLAEKGRRRVAVNTIFATPPPVRDQVKAEMGARLDRLGITVASMCSLMHCMNPLLATSRLLTNSAKLRNYSTARYAANDDVLRAILGEAI